MSQEQQAHGQAQVELQAIFQGLPPVSGARVLTGALTR